MVVFQSIAKHYVQKCFVLPTYSTTCISTFISSNSRVKFERHAKMSINCSIQKQHSKTFPELMNMKMKLFDHDLTIIQPSSVDEVLDMYINSGQLDRDPYWCRLWPSAIALANHVLEYPELVYGKRVCEIGAGLGIGGISALMAGAKEVVLFDREEIALNCALLTAHANIPWLNSNLTSLFPVIKEDYDSMQIKGSDERSNRFGFDQTMHACIFDWSKPIFEHGKFDAVLACDVLYESSAVDFISDLIPQLLQTDVESSIIIADPTHRVPSNRERFIHIMESSLPKKMQLSILERHPYLDEANHSVQILNFN